VLGRRRGGYRRSRPRIGTADGWPAPRAGRALLVAGWLLAVGLSVVLASARSAAVTPSSGAITGTVTDQQGRPAAGV
jgi:hypothetical protein